jgi:hypothetical protein
VEGIASYSLGKYKEEPEKEFKEQLSDFSDNELWTCCLWYPRHWGFCFFPEVSWQVKVLKLN